MLAITGRVLSLSDEARSCKQLMVLLGLRIINILIPFSAGTNQELKYSFSIDNSTKK